MMPIHNTTIKACSNSIVIDIQSINQDRKGSIIACLLDRVDMQTKTVLYFISVPVVVICPIM